MFYPAVREEVPNGAKLADEGADEHGEARQLIGRIKNTEDGEHLAEPGARARAGGFTSRERRRERDAPEGAHGARR